MTKINVGGAVAGNRTVRVSLVPWKQKVSQ